MRWNRITLCVGVGLILVAAMALVGCSKKSSNKITNVQVLELDSGDLASGRPYDHTFANAGSFTYHCARHSQMHGTVTVAAGNPMSASVSIVDFAFQPNATPVAPGGMVHWVNNGSATHTVTSDAPNP